MLNSNLSGQGDSQGASKLYVKNPSTAESRRAVKYRIADRGAIPLAKIHFVIPTEAPETTIPAIAAKASLAFCLLASATISAIAEMSITRKLIRFFDISVTAPNSHGVQIIV